MWSSGPDEGERGILLRMREDASEPARLNSASVGPSCLVSQTMTGLMKSPLLTQLGWDLVLLGSASADRAKGAAEVARAAGLNVEVLQALGLALQKEVDKKNASGVIGREGKIGYYDPSRPEGDQGRFLQ